MKKLLVLVFIITLLAGCVEGNVSEPSEKYSIGYEVVTVQMIDGYSVYQIRNIETGCHFAYAPDASLEEIYHQVDGVSVPYCTERSK